MFEYFWPEYQDLIAGSGQYGQLYPADYFERRFRMRRVLFEQLFVEVAMRN